VTLSSLEVVNARNDFAASPEQVLITSSAGSRLINVGQSTTFNFAPLVTNSVTVSFPKVKTLMILNGFGGRVQAPVGLADLKFSALASFQGKTPNLTSSFSLPCGSGPPIVIDGKQYETSVERVGRGPSPTIGDLLALKPMGLGICSPFGSLTLKGGSHELVAPRTAAPFDISTLTLNQVVTPPAHQPVARQARVLNWAQESRNIAITSGAATYLEVHQNFNAGWTATLNGKTLAPIRLDGWQQGYLVPAGRSGTVHLTFGPEKTYLYGLAAGALGVILLLLIAFGVLGRRRGDRLEPAPPWKKRVPFWLSIGLAGGVIFVIGGPLVLAVPVLVFIGTRRRAWLPAIALIAMTAAGVIAAYHPGSGALSGLGAFSAPAQACALIALAAVLVPIMDRRPKSDEDPNPLTVSVPGALDGAFVGVADDSLNPVGTTHGDRGDGGTS
jgi:arabinofuranan 3-O-arabinosyltransferase